MSPRSNDNGKYNAVTVGSSGEWAQDIAHIDGFQVLRRAIESYLQENTDQELNTIDLKEDNGQWKATPVYKDKRITFSPDA
jgi:hypothetical protein